MPRRPRAATSKRPPPPPERIIRRTDLFDFVGLRRTVIDAMVAAGTFPAPIQLNDSGRAVGWIEREVLEWQRSRIADRDRARWERESHAPRGRAGRRT